MGDRLFMTRRGFLRAAGLTAGAGDRRGCCQSASELGAVYVDFSSILTACVGAFGSTHSVANRGTKKPPAISGQGAFWSRW